MRRLLLISLAVLLLIPLLYVDLAWAVGQQFNGDCTTVSWNQVTTTDLASYNIYDRTAPTGSSTVYTVGPNVISVPCAFFHFNAGQHYLSISAFDASGNNSAESAQVAFVIIKNNQITDLRVSSTTTTSFTMSWTEVDDGTGSPAKMQFKFNTPGIDNFNTAPAVTNGTCGGVVTGTTIGATKSCTITSLTNGVTYQVQGIPYRGILQVDAVFGPTSNIATGTAGVVPTGSRTALIVDTFTRANGSLGADWQDISGTAYTINGNLIQPNAAGAVTSIDFHRGELPAKQWCQIVLSSVTTTDDLFAGCMLRTTLGQWTGYWMSMKKGTGAGNGSVINRRDNGVSTNVTSEAATVWAAGDVLRGEADGCTLTIFRNDVQILQGTDCTYATGYSGLATYLNSGAATLAQLDNFQAGSFDRITITTDSFTRSDGALGSPWNAIGVGWAISSNVVQSSTAAPQLPVNANTTILAADQWCQVKLTTITGSDDIFVGCTGRASASVDTEYAGIAVKGTGNGSRIVLRQNGTHIANLFLETTTTWANGDILRLDLQGTSLRVYRNGIFLGSATDATLTNGVSGLWGYINAGAVGNMQVDDFSAGGFVTLSSSDICGCDAH